MTRSATQILLASVVCIALAGCGGGGTQPSDSASGTTSPHTASGGTGAKRRPRTLTRARRAAILNRYALAAAEVKSFGAPASSAELAAVSSSIKSYLAAAAAHEYAKACSLTTAARQRPQHGKQCPELLAATFARGFYKGLEATVVLLCEMEEVHDSARRSLWYTGLSRARSALILLVHDPDGSLTAVGVDDVLAAVLPGGRGDHSPG